MRGDVGDVATLTRSTDACPLCQEDGARGGLGGGEGEGGRGRGRGLLYIREFVQFEVCGEEGRGVGRLRS